MISQNEDLLIILRSIIDSPIHNQSRIYVGIEKIASQGMAVGQTVFDTADWGGRFHQCVEDRDSTIPVYKIKRHTIKIHICNSARAKDTNIRQALIDRFGAQGTKKNQGKTYGMKKDMWSALAVAVTCYDTKLKHN
jgi:hypothetical protein